MTELNLVLFSVVVNIGSLPNTFELFLKHNLEKEYFILCRIEGNLSIHHLLYKKAEIE